MSVGEIKYISEPHPVTGVTNAKLAMWLFLCTEVMLFGGLFSAYLLLRVGNDAWPLGSEAGLNWKVGVVNTFILIASSVSIVFAWTSLLLKKFDQHRMWLALTIILAVAFFVIKITLEYIPKISHGAIPATSTYYAIYYTMTGLHALHVLGGVVVLAYFLSPFGAKMWKTEPERFAGRIEVTGLYWHFVDLVWIFLFPILYLM